jgi:FKBP-type peptidyl-prolyl cis-trans isomerase
MRRITTIRAPLPRAALAGLSSLTLLSFLALSGCGSSGSSGSGVADNSSVTATGSFGQDPVVKIPHEKAGSALAVKTLIAGTGPALTQTDALVGNYAVYIWSGIAHHLAADTYARGKSPALFAGRLLPGLETALLGKKIGSRVLVVIPPKEGYGSAGNSQGGVKPTDTLVFVVDMIQAFPANASATGQSVSAGGHGLPTVSTATGTAPKVTIPHGKPPATLVAHTLIKGTGSQVRAGQTVVVQYTGVIWRTGKVFDSSWSRGQPFGFTIDASPPQVISGWNTGLTAQTVGSRILLVIPSKDGYGSQGASQAGIKGTDTLVFVVDVLGAFGSAS